MVAIECKRADRWDPSWNKPMLALATASGVKVDYMFGVYGGSRAYRFDDVQVWPVADFVKALFAGEVF